MGISQIQAGQAILGAIRTAGARQELADVVAEAATPSTRVTLSAVARQALRDEAGVGTSGQTDRLEHYALPAWMGDMLPVSLSGKLGGGVADQYAKGGELMGQSSPQAAEYSDRLFSHYQTLLKQQGIDTPQQHYQALVADSASSERFHQMLLDSVRGDGRMQSLAAQLGIAGGLSATQGAQAVAG